MFKTTSVLLGFVVAFASAQGFTPSPNCINAIGALASNQAVSTCLNFPGAIALGTTPPGMSIVPNFDSWVGGICSVPTCSADTLGLVGSAVTTGCASDLQSLPPGTNVTQYLVQYYPTVRHILCLKDNAGGNTFCITELLTYVETATGMPLTVQNIGATLTRVFTMNSLPKEVACHACSQAGFNILEAEQPQLFTDGTAAAAANQLCGPTFATGGVPSTITDPGTV